MARTAPLALVALWAVLYLPGLGQSDLLSTNEANRALAAREMLARGDWVMPTLLGEPYLNKPPLYYWQAMLSYRLFGDGEPAARLPAALAALAACLVGYAYFAGQGRPRAGLWAGTLIASIPLLVIQGTEAELDSGLVLWLFLCELFMLRALTGDALRNTLWAWFFLALATLTKGPVALAFFAPMLIMQLAFLARIAGPAGLLGPHWPRWCTAHLLGLGLGILIVAPWCIMVVQRLGWDYAWGIVQRESLTRAVEASRINAEPFWFYLPRFLLGCLPWTPLLWLLRVHPARDGRDGLARRYLGWCSAAQFILFSLFAGKETQYLLPVLPPLAVAVAYGLEAETERCSSRLTAWIGGVCLTALAILGGGGVLAGLFSHSHRAAAWTIGPGGALLALAAGAFYLRRGRRAWWAAAVGTALFFSLFWGFVRAPDRNQRHSMKAPMTAVLAETPASAQVHVYRYGKSQLFYYLRGRGLVENDVASLVAGDYLLYPVESEADLSALELEPLLEVSARGDALRLARVKRAAHAPSSP